MFDAICRPLRVLVVSNTSSIVDLPPLRFSTESNLNLVLRLAGRTKHLFGLLITTELYWAKPDKQNSASAALATSRPRASQCWHFLSSKPNLFSHLRHETGSNLHGTAQWTHRVAISHFISQSTHPCRRPFMRIMPIASNSTSR